MSARCALSDEQLDELAALRERGWSANRIAAHFASQGAPISRSTVHYHCKRIGADVPQRLQYKTFDLRAPYWRGGRQILPWTAEDDSVLLKHERRGIAINAIARQLGRQESSVRGRLLTLARREARQEAGTLA